MPTLTPPVTDQDHCQGSPRAAVTLVEYGDFQCPSCGEAYPLLKQVQKKMGERLRFVFRHFPLEQHPMAEPAAETAEFAAASGKFWAMHDALYEHQSRLSPELFATLAGKFGLPEKKLEEALDQGTYREAVQADEESGEASDVDGTPSLYINGEKYTGGYSFDSLLRALEDAAAA